MPGRETAGSEGGGRDSKASRILPVLLGTVAGFLCALVYLRIHQVRPHLLLLTPVNYIPHSDTAGSERLCSRGSTQLCSCEMLLPGLQCCATISTVRQDGAPGSPLDKIPVMGLPCNAKGRSGIASSPDQHFSSNTRQGLHGDPPVIQSFCRRSRSSQQAPAAPQAPAPPGTGGGPGAGLPGGSALAGRQGPVQADPSLVCGADHHSGVHPLGLCPRH